MALAVEKCDGVPQLRIVRAQFDTWKAIIYARGTYIPSRVRVSFQQYIVKVIFVDCELIAFR